MPRPKDPKMDPRPELEELEPVPVPTLPVRPLKHEVRLERLGMPPVVIDPVKPESSEERQLLSPEGRAEVTVPSALLMQDITLLMIPLKPLMAEVPPLPPKREPMPPVPPLPPNREPMPPVPPLPPKREPMPPVVEPMMPVTQLVSCGMRLVMLLTEGTVTVVEEPVPVVVLELVPLPEPVLVGMQALKLMLGMPTFPPDSALVNALVRDEMQLLRPAGRGRPLSALVRQVVSEVTTELTFSVPVTPEVTPPTALVMQLSRLGARLVRLEVSEDSSDVMPEMFGTVTPVVPPVVVGEELLLLPPKDDPPVRPLRRELMLGTVTEPEAPTDPPTPGTLTEVLALTPLEDPPEDPPDGL